MRAILFLTVLSGLVFARPGEAQTDAAIDYLTALQRHMGGTILSSPAERADACKRLDEISARMKSPLSADGAPDCKTILGDAAATPFESAEFVWLRRYIERRVHSGLKHLDLTLAADPVIGTLQEKLLNAKTISVPNSGRPLIVVNDELFKLPYDACRAAVESLNFTDTDGRLAAQLDQGSVTAYLSQHPEIENSFEFSVLRYLHRVSYTLPDGTPTADSMVGALKMRLYSGLTDATELFAISHEFAHLVLKHDSGQSGELDLLGAYGKSMSVKESLRSWRQEFAADAFGFAILDATLQSEGDREYGSYLKNPFYPFLVSAPRFYFTLMYLVENADSVIDTGEPKAVVSQRDLELARDAIANMFEPGTEDTKKGTDTESKAIMASHPAFELRAGLMQKLERKAISQFLAHSDLGDGIRGLEELSDGFVTALFALSHSAARDFRLLRTAAQSNAPSVAKPETPTTDVSANVIYTELKERGVDPLSSGIKTDMNDAFVDYHYRSDGKSLNAQATSPEIQRSAEALSNVMAKTALMSRVRVKTKLEGARVRYRLIGRQSSTAFSQLTNEAAEPLTIGLYHVWAEREGVATSSQTEVFRIIRPDVIVDLEERPDAKRH